MLATRRFFLGSVAASGLASTALATDFQPVVRIGEYERSARSDRYAFASFLVSSQAAAVEQNDNLLDILSTSGESLLENRRHSSPILRPCVAVFGAFDRKTQLSDFAIIDLTPHRLGTSLKSQSSPVESLRLSLLNNRVDLITSSSLDRDQSAFAFCLKQKA